MNLPSGYTSTSAVLVMGYAYDGMRFSYVLPSTSVNFAVPATATAHGKVQVNIITGVMTNTTSVTVAITHIFSIEGF